MITAVFDTNVYFQAAVGPGGPASECWMAAQAGVIDLYSCETIFSEIQDVLFRPKLRQKFPILTTVRVRALLRSYRFYTKMVADPPKVFRFPRDIDDEIFVDLAVAVGADYLVSRDRDLLDLRNDSGFSSEFPLLKIVDPFEFLTAVRTK